MTIKPIKTKKDYKDSLKKIEKLWEAKPSTKEGDELEILAVLVEKYEAENYPISLPTPIEAIKFRMEQMGLTKKDLGKIIGANRVSEILNKKRGLSLNMIKNLHEKLNIPAEFLLN